MRSLAELSPLVRAVLARLRTEIETHVGPVGLSLFGSYARGEANETSDLDVLVVVDQVTGDARKIVADVAAMFYAEHGLLVNPILFERGEYERRLAAGHPLLRTIVAEGIAA